MSANEDEIAQFLQEGGSIEEAERKFGKQFQSLQFGQHVRTIKALWRLDKFEDDPNDEIAKYLQAGHSIAEASAHFAKSPEHVEMGFNVLLDAGLTNLMNRLGGISATAFDNSNARIGVGDSSTAATHTQTGLQAATNHFFQGMDSTYPQVSTNTITWRVSIATGNGNQSWQEFIVDNAVSATGGSSGYTTGLPTYTSTYMALNRFVQNAGTKASGTWVLSVILTIT